MVWIYTGDYDTKVVTYRKFRQIRNCEIAEALNDPEAFAYYLANTKGQTMHSLFFASNEVKNKLWDEWTLYCEEVWEKEKGLDWEEVELEDIEE